MASYSMFLSVLGLCFLMAMTSSFQPMRKKRDAEAEPVAPVRGVSDKEELTQCSEADFRCLVKDGDTQECIPQEWKCDGETDCPLGDDEENCVYTCSGGKFTCSDGSCIPAEWRCDGDKDCPVDGNDELNC